MLSKPVRLAVFVVAVAIGLLLSPGLTGRADAAAHASLHVPNQLGEALASFGFLAAAVAVGVLVAGIIRR